MNAAFGIDHPLLATRDIHVLRNRLIAVGFNMTTIGKHPWGTSTSLAMFQGCLIEIMGMYDDCLIDEVPAGDFRFGRHIFEHLQAREGVALTALHSTNSVADAAKAAKAGFHVSGHLEFGRDVTLPDGQQGRTKTTLALMPDPKWPRLSFFLCQQHRPELIYVPAWLEHPNSVTGYGGVSILASDDDLGPLIDKFSGLYGASETAEGGVTFQTANGQLRLLTEVTLEQRYGPMPKKAGVIDAPSIVALDLVYSDRMRMETCLRKSGLAYIERGDDFQLIDPSLYANTHISFVPKPGS